MTGTIRPAPVELAELVCTMRADWDRTDVDGAIFAAGLALADRDQAKAWLRVASELVRIAGDPEGRPRDLTESIRKPLQPHGPPADPSDVVAYTQARQAMADRAAARVPDGDV